MFEGRALRFDSEVLYPLLAELAETKGIMAPAEFTGRLRNANPVTLLKGTERPGLYQDILKGLDDANLRLEHEREEFCKTFESAANTAADGLLDKSEETIKAELARLGITGDVVRDPGSGGVPDFRLSNTEAAKSLKQAAAELVPLAKELDETQAAAAAASNRLDETKRGDPFNLTNKPLVEAEQARRKRWMEASEAYETARRAKVAAQPALAMYTEQPGAASRLGSLATMDDQSLANDIGSQARQRLDNIKQVRGEIGKRFVVWNQPHLRRVTLDSLQATRFQREAVDWKVKEQQRGADDDKLFFTVLAIGLGLVSAIPTLGTGVLAGIAAAAAAAGAGLSLYQFGEEGAGFSLAIAANATDFEKAKAISEQEPDGLQLALDCVSALGDVFAAAAAFKALKGVVGAAKAGEVNSALRVAGVADGVGVGGAAKSKIVAEAVAGLSDEAVEEVAKTMVRSGGLTQQEHIAKLMVGLAERKQFQGELVQAIEMMEHVQGRIPETARKMVASGRVQVFSEASLINVYGPVEGPENWKKLIAQGADGCYSKSKNIIFASSGHSAEDLAGLLIHEATHKLGSANPVRMNGFLSEAIAEFAERDFYMTLYAENGPLAGKVPTSRRIREFLSWSDEQLMHNIEVRYFEGKKNLDPAKRALYRNVGNLSAEEITKHIFDDVAADFEASLPRAP